MAIGESQSVFTRPASKQSNKDVNINIETALGEIFMNHPQGYHLKGGLGQTDM